MENYVVHGIRGRPRFKIKTDNVRYLSCINAVITLFYSVIFVLYMSISSVKGDYLMTR